MKCPFEDTKCVFTVLPFLQSPHEVSQTPTKSALLDLIVGLGKKLNFDVVTEVEASESAWVDIVWFDKRLPVAALSSMKPKMRYAPVLSVAAFEVELHTALNAKHVKGSVSNLSNLGAPLGVIVVGAENLIALQNQPANKDKTPAELEKTLRDRLYRWIYAEAQPKGRLIVMFEREVIAWASKLEKLASSGELPNTAFGTTTPVGAVP
jgi:hypothetical protein